MTACNRFIRSRKTALLDLRDADGIAASGPDPREHAEANELKDRILHEIAALSEKNRLVTTLQLINGYSTEEISEFLELPASTIKSRLHESRKHLQGRLMKMAEDILHTNKPGDGFIRNLRKNLNGRIVPLPDGRAQVFYDFANEKELGDWRIIKPYDARPKIKEGLAFGEVKEQQTADQWDRNIRLNLVFDSNPVADLEIEFDVSVGKAEPWQMAGWLLTRRDGYGDGIASFQGEVLENSEEWRHGPRAAQSGFPWKDGFLIGSFIRRNGEEAKGKGPANPFLAPSAPVPIAGSYHMRITRQDQQLRFAVNGQIIGETVLSDEEMCLTERLVLCNFGKGTGAVFQNVVIRSRIAELDPVWPGAGE